MSTYIIVTAFIILVGLLIHSERKNISKQLDEQSEISNALGRMYFSVYFCDLLSGRFVELKSPDDVNNIIGKDGLLSEMFSRLINLGVAEKSREEMKKFTDIFTLRERLRDVQSLTHDYESIKRGWCRANWVIVSRDSDGYASSALYVVSDVDEEVKKELEYNKQLAQAARDAKIANQAKSDFLSRMSHDIRTPMNVIVGMTEIAMRSSDDMVKVLECIEKIHIESIRLQTLVDDVLDISTIEAGKMSIKPEEIKLQNVIDSMNSSIKSLVMTKGIDYSCNVVNIFFPYVIGDSLRINQIYLNLLSNAVKYTPAGGKVRFSIWQSMAEENGYVNLHAKVEDTGIGMTKESIDSIYTKFFRCIDTRVNKIQGSGLGLTIVKELVELMNGTIEVQSEVSKGTVFEIMLPVKYVEKTDGRQVNDEETIECEKLEGLNFLVVEDNDYNYEIVEELLEMHNAKMFRAENGQIAYEFMEKMLGNNENESTSLPLECVDVILMDMQMPVMDGLEATRSIRSINHKMAKKIPIIAMTANAYKEDELACMEAGMDGFVTKPIQLNKFIGQIVNCLEESKRK